VSSLRKEISQKLRPKSFGEASLGRQIVSRTLTCFKTPKNLKYGEPLPKTPSSRFQKHLLKKERNDITFSRPGGDARAAEESLALQKQLGCEADWWSPDRIKKEFPLVEVNDFVGGTFGPRDGYLDPYALLMAYRSKAVSLGVRFIADEVVELIKFGNTIEGVRLASGQILHSAIVVNAAGAWASEVARTAGVELPIVPILSTSPRILMEYNFLAPLAVANSELGKGGHP
jgi:hypothetical protein